MSIVIGDVSSGYVLPQHSCRAMASKLRRKILKKGIKAKLKAVKAFGLKGMLNKSKAATATAMAVEVAGGFDSGRHDEGAETGAGVEAEGAGSVAGFKG